MENHIDYGRGNFECKAIVGQADEEVLISTKNPIKILDRTFWTSRDQLMKGYPSPKLHLSTEDQDRKNGLRRGRTGDMGWFEGQ